MTSVAGELKSRSPASGAVIYLPPDYSTVFKPNPPAKGQEIQADAAREFEPQVVGVTSMFNNSLQAERLIQTIKECDDSIVTVGGGSHFGALTLRSLQRIPQLDYAIEGEGEEAFALLLAGLASGASVAEIPRLCHRVDGEPRQNPARGLMDLADIPPVWPLLDTALDIDRYRRTVPAGSVRRIFYLEAGRGCPFRCTFCATAPFWERKYRVRPVSVIVEEMRFLHERWPPAPLSQSGLPARFDLDSLRIEYPFLEVPQDDASIIEGDPDFFAGYFAPYTTAGSFAEMAQVELFFNYANSAAPLTIAVMSRLAGETLIPVFYQVLSREGGLVRSEVEGDHSSPWPAWNALRPRLEAWIALHPALAPWQRQLVRGAMRYEESRLHFTTTNGETWDGAEAGGEDWAAFVSSVDIATLFERLRDDQPLTPALVSDWAVVFVEQGDGTIGAYTTDVDRLSELSGRPSLMAGATVH